MSRTIGFCACIVAVIVLPASAAIHQLQANLDGLQVVAPNASPAFGQADFTLDDATGVLTVTTGTYQDLLGGATSVSINGPAAVGANAASIFALTLDTPGAATGTFSGSGVLTPALTTSALAPNNQTYVIIRSQVFPSGEIRGQLIEVPEPASLLLVGASGVLLLSRRRKAL